MTEDQLRNLAADSMAQGFLVDMLLAEYFTRLGEKRFLKAQKILDEGEMTDHFKGLAPDEEEAEVFSDVVVRMHEMLDRYVGRALVRAAAAEERVAGRKP